MFFFLPFLFVAESNGSGSNAKITLSFENDWQPQSEFPINRIRLPPPVNYLDNGSNDGDSNSNVCPIGEGMEVEVLTSSNEGEQCGWWRAVVKMIKGDFHVVEYQPTLTNSSTNCELGGHSHGTYSEIVPSDRIRYKNPNPCLTSNPFFKIEIPAPDDLKQTSSYYKSEAWVNKAEAHKQLKQSIEAIAVRYEENKQVLIVIGYAPKDINHHSMLMKKRATMLSDMHFRNLKQKMAILARKDEVAKQLESSKGVGYNSGYGSSGYPYPSGQTNQFTDEFTVATHLMGLAIGTHGTNIQNARKMDNIVSIDLDEDTCTFRYQATLILTFVICFLLSHFAFAVKQALIKQHQH